MSKNGILPSLPHDPVSQNNALKVCQASKQRKRTKQNNRNKLGKEKKKLLQNANNLLSLCIFWKNITKNPVR